MQAAKYLRAPVMMQPFARFNPEQAVRHKKEHDERRKAIRAQNARAKSLK